eukprot:CCRYP_009407-RA/>CCRYP_009407-RA protein AED:0.13 eAED:0.13 QI:276/1/1/1/1/1/2/2004/395
MSDVRSDAPPRRSPRQLWWGGLFLSSLTAMGSTFEAVRTQRSLTPPTVDPTPTQQWAVASATSTFLLTFLTLTAQKLPSTSHRVTGTKLEMTLILLLLAFAAAAVGASTNPATGLAVNASGGVSFGNLYYATWVTFASAMALCLAFVRTERGVDVEQELRSRGNRFRSWVILIVTTLIVMASSASSYDAQCDGEVVEVRPVKYCRRAALGVSVGCVGCVASLVIVAMRLLCLKQGQDDDRGNGNQSNKMVFAAEGITGAVLFCMYGFAVAYLTSEKGPGAPIGNLYYSSWITFGMTFFVVTSCFEEFQAAKSMILTGRLQRQHQQQQPPQSILRDTESLHAPSDVTSLDTGRVGAGPSDWSVQERDAEEMWGDAAGPQPDYSITGSSSVGEVQIN